MEKVKLTLNEESLDEIIDDKMFFIVIDSKNFRKIVNVHSEKIRFTKIDINPKRFLGKKLNTFWEYDSVNKDFFEITSDDFYKEEIVETDEKIDYTNENILKANNKEIYSQSIEEQKIKQCAIKELQEKGLTGDELIEQVKNSNKSITGRTIMSQNKILKRLEQRHKYQIFLAKTTLINIMETIYLDFKDTKFLLYMRVDTISTILQNIKLLKGSKTMVYDDTNGFITSAIAGRSSSEVLSIYETRPFQRMIQYFNFKDDIKRNISYMRFSCLINNKLILSENKDDEMTQELSFFSKIRENFQESFSNLVITTSKETSIVEIFMTLFPYLKSSGSIVVYGRDKEYLVTLEKYLFENKLAMCLNIIETFFREYQVLPLRTHPMMNMKGYSNYVLTGIKTCN